MRNTVSLNRNADFRRLYAKGKTATGGLLAVYTRANRPGRFANGRPRPSVNRLGITVSVKLGGAVLRNRLRRRLRELYRLEESNLRAGYDIVLVARARAANAPFSALQKEARSLFARLGLLTGAGGDGV